MLNKIAKRRLKIIAKLVNILNIIKMNFDNFKTAKDASGIQLNPIRNQTQTTQR